MNLDKTRLNATSEPVSFTEGVTNLAKERVTNLKISTQIADCV